MMRCSNRPPATFNVVIIDICDARVQSASQPGARDRAVNVQLLRELTLGMGIPLPVTSARTFDYALHGSSDWSF
jgi:hypothetical protein